MTSPSSSYDATLAELAAKRPRLAAALQQAQQQRAHQAASLLHGARLPRPSSPADVLAGHDLVDAQDAWQRTREM
jgi:hypothetical protein